MMDIGKDLQDAFNDGYERAMQDKWIPVKERLPENGTYICTIKGELCGLDEPFTGMCGFENGKWDEEDCIIAWMPLPEPWKEDNVKEIK